MQNEPDNIEITDESDNSVENISPKPEKRKEQNSKGKSSKKLIIIIIVAALVIAAGVTAFLIIDNNKSENDKKPTEDSQTDEQPNEEISSEYSVVEWTGTTYTPTRLFLKDADNAKAKKDTYKSIAKLQNGSELVNVSRNYINPDGFEQGSGFFFLVSSDKIEYLYGMSTSDSDGSNAPLADGISKAKINIPGITAPDKITYDGKTFIFRGHNYGLTVSSLKKNFNVTKLATLDEGDLYEAASKKVNDSNMLNSTDIVYARVIELETKDGLLHRYIPEYSLVQNDDATAKINWNDEKNKTALFSNPIKGCGIDYTFTSVILAKDLDTSIATQVGTLQSNGNPVYKYTSGALFDELYKEYAATKYDGDDTLSKDEYKNPVTHIIFQDSLGKWNLLTNNEYGLQAECGKPVVYLYPETDTIVNIRVGANVRISEPLYPASTGWQNVLARPNGQLTYNGSNYNSLYWEGRGFGEYPSVTGIGTVVTQKNLVSTVKNQLKAQGLNSTEIADFLEFWSEHLPKTPYIKLTWLTTAQMNTLAPLTVSPAPNTVIRVFLDAEGLEAPVKLTPQTFTAPERKGFTLVEWGGLLY